MHRHHQLIVVKQQQVQVEFADELNGAVGKLVSFEESKRLTFEVLKEVAMELTKDMAPGWARVCTNKLLDEKNETNPWLHTIMRATN